MVVLETISRMRYFGIKIGDYVDPNLMNRELNNDELLYLQQWADILAAFTVIPSLPILLYSKALALFYPLKTTRKVDKDTFEKLAIKIRFHQEEIAIACTKCHSSRKYREYLEFYETRQKQEYVCLNSFVSGNLVV